MPSHRSTPAVGPPSSNPKARYRVALRREGARENKVVFFASEAAAKSLYARIILSDQPILFAELAIVNGKRVEVLAFHFADESSEGEVKP